MQDFAREKCEKPIGFAGNVFLNQRKLYCFA